MRSGREGPVEIDGVDEALDGLAEAVEGELPKKSRPIKELLGSDCLEGAEAFGGVGRVPGVSVVLGLAGGVGISPKMSGLGAGLCREVAGWIEDDDFCWDEDRSSFAFSWTTLRGYWQTRYVKY